MDYTVIERTPVSNRDRQLKMNYVIADKKDYITDETKAVKRGCIV